ncbi:MAG: tetratricopeptide repeat protein [Gammaproteobacteria bacterium]|nr:tetratricopeptide repeat protein [Gammaproteobacteria bacterium]
MAGSFTRELQRRNVFRVAGMYVVVSWLLMQVGDVMFSALHLPEWTITMLVAFLILGFPIAVILAWAYEVTPEGIKRTSAVDTNESITRLTGRKINYSIIAALALALVFLLGRLWLLEDASPVGATSTPDKSIAVLPFGNRSADKENAEFFADGIQDELLTLLSQLGELKVTSRTSVERLDPKLSVPQIGALLGVATVLEGQVQRAGDRVRINVQLIDAAREDHIWASTYDRVLTAENVFDVQSEIARAIAEALHVQLSANDEALIRSVPTQNTEALNQYMLGRHLLAIGSFDSYKQAVIHFDKATELDPGYAQAWIGMANTAGMLLNIGSIDVPQYLSMAGPAITRALQLDDQLPAAHAQLGNLHWRAGDLEAAEVSFKRALELNPRDPDSLETYGRYLRTTNRPQQAIPVLEKALAADPLSNDLLFELGKSEMYSGHPEKNVLYGKRILDINPSFTNGYIALLQAYLWMGRYDLMWPWYLESMASDPEDFEMAPHMAYYSETLGEPAWADRYLELGLRIGPGEPAGLMCQAQILAHRGQAGEALAIARQALQANLDDRWSSDQVFLRLVRDEALRTGEFEESLAWYRHRNPELFADSPTITINNVNAAADLALLLQRSGAKQAADVLIETGLAWFAKTQPVGVHGYLLEIVDVEFLALRGDTAGALAALDQAVSGGWNAGWRWPFSSPNLDSLRESPQFEAITAKLESDMVTQLKAIQALPYQGELDLR